MSKLTIPPQYAGMKLADLSRDQLLEVLEASDEGGIKIGFAGKTNARRIARSVRPRVSRTVAKYCVGSPSERAPNLVIEGDNLQTMVTLYKERGHVDFILTDPPYNTGKDFRYNDRWDEDPNDPGLGEFVSADDGARHTKWMRFMWPRLQMMKSMLKPKGVLAICIDHRELFRLGQMLDELFGEHNRIGVINWQKAFAPKNDAKHLSTATEYVLVYAKDISRAQTGLLPRDADMDSAFKNVDDDPLGAWSGKDPTVKEFRKNTVFGIQSPFTGTLHYPGLEYRFTGSIPKPTHHWRGISKADMKRHLEAWAGAPYEERDLGDGLGLALVLKSSTITLMPYEPRTDKAVENARRCALRRHSEGHWPPFYFREDRNKEIGAGRPRLKNYLSHVKKGKVALTYWADEDYGHPLTIESQSWDHAESGHAKESIGELDAIIGRDHEFQTVKPLKLFKKLIQIWCPPNGVVLDPFAGSGTTGHAVLQLNADVGANRRFILIEQGRPEKGDSYTRTLLAERLRRVIIGDWASGKADPVPGGFSFMSLGKKVDAAALLRMERDEMVDTVIASHFDATRRRGDQLVRLESTRGKAHRYLVAKNADDEGFFLVWDGADKNTDFTEDVYEVCAKEAAAAGLKATSYHVYARLYRYQTEGIYFYQIPDRILADFGLDLKNEPFFEDDYEEELT